MNPIELPNRLRKARDNRGISQQSAAEFVGLPRTAITQIEGGNRSVSTLELTKLAKLYRYPISYFLDEISNDEEDIDVVLYRAAPNLNETTKQQIYHYIDLCKEGIVLEKILDFEPRANLPKYSLPIPKNKGEAVTQGTNIAEQERKRLSIGIGSIADIANLISNQGIWACSADLPDDVSGLFLNNAKAGLIILVNANHVISRKRFSYAHEYAHALFDRDENIRISSTANNAEFIEVRANAFAAAFLMPADGITEVLRSLNKGKASRHDQIVFDVSANSKVNVESRAIPYSQSITFQDIAIIAHHFGVSYQAAVYRLRSLNVISQKECDQLIAKYQDGKHYLSSLNMFSDLEKKESRELWDRVLRTELSYLAIEAFRREEISRGRIIELGDAIGIGGKDLYEFALATLESDNTEKPC
jgi:Zn-dependent peptidase ImmA (M78 family)/DNA-binding XRE family transcriptional regulator